MLTLLASISLLIYLLLGWHFYKVRLANQHILPEWLTHILLAIGILLHASSQTQSILHSPPFFGASEALSLTAWLALAIYGIGQLRLRLDGIELPLFIFASAFTALAIALPQGHAITYAQTGLSRGHFLLAMLAQSALFIAAGIAVLMRMTDSTLHHHAKKLLLGNLPPLLTLERLLFSTIACGFILLTLALIAGATLNFQTYGSIAQFSHKTVLALASWALFASLLLGHQIRGWRGRFAANWTLIAFAVLFLGYIGSRIALEAIFNKA
ncbi:inner membrane protein YpjD [Chitinibacter sp. S2-10]|uniref:cytochrome C assembly family protein n=1 Tax=Chitinibacter sp. S2-10 TaxID=3373597 RepID=UPI0039775D78